MNEKFSLQERLEHILPILDRIERPDGVRIRPVSFKVDLSAIRDLPATMIESTMLPAWGMVSEEEAGGFTLVAEKSGAFAGQISCGLEISYDADGASVDLWLDGAFVIAPLLGEGIGTALGRAALDVVEDWRRSFAAANHCPVAGDIAVSGNADESPTGQALLSKMQGYADALSEQAFRDTEGEEPEVL